METRPEAPARGYDRVVVRAPDGPPRELSRADFEALPLLDRVRVLIDGTARFYREGLEVAQSEAVRR